MLAGSRQKCCDGQTTHASAYDRNFHDSSLVRDSVLTRCSRWVTTSDWFFSTGGWLLAFPAWFIVTMGA